MKILVIALFMLLLTVRVASHGRRRTSTRTQDNSGSTNESLHGSTFWVFESHSSVDWNEANDSCNSNFGGALAILDSIAKRNLTKNLIQGRGKKYWVGLRSTNNQLEWLGWIPAKSITSSLAPSSNATCYFIKNDKGFFFKQKLCNERVKGMICESRTSTTPDISSTQTTQQTSATTHTSSPEYNPTSTIHHQRTTQPTSASTHTSSPEYNPTSTMHHQTTQPTSASTHTSSPEYNPTSTIHQAVPMTTSAVSSVVKPTPDLPSSTSSMQPSQHSPSTSTLMRTTSNINATTSTVLSSTAAKPPTTAAMPSTSYQEDVNMINRFHNVMKNLNTNHPDCMSKLLSEYDDLMEWMDNKNEDMEYNPLTDARDIEDIALEFTKKHLDSNRKKMSTSKKEIAFHAILIDSDRDSDVIFPEPGEDPEVNTISLPKSLFKGQVTCVVNVEFKNKKTLPRLAPKVMEGRDDAEKNWTVNTGIFSTTIFPKRKEPFEYVNITLRHIQKLKDAKPHCSFWNYSIPTSHNGSWSEHGCYVVSHTETETVCACNHLTNFAVLMNLNSEKVPSVHEDALMVITYVGLGLSLLGEAITVLLYCFFLNLRHEKIQIRVNLLCVLAAAQIVFLAGIDKIENKGLCTFVAALIHLLYLVCFCWMLMEGVYLYRMVVQVFDAHVNMRYSYIFAFGLPSCIVVVSLIAAAAKSDGIYSYISSEYCWMRLDNGFIWSFIVPMLMLIAINTFFLFSVLKEMALMKSVKTINSLELSSIRASARACVVLLPLLGITWVFGLLSLISSGVWWQYIFTIFNAMQGFMIFLFHCLRNTELRAAIELRYFQWESTHSHGQNRSITPSKFMAFEESEKSRSNSIPMATKGNQVTPT